MVSRDDMLRANILIVDDSLADLELLQRMLMAAGYSSVETTNDPHRVYELHRARHFDLILLDLLMPGFDGFAVLEGLRELEADGYVAVLVITAAPKHRLRALRAGAKAVISKPFDMPEILMHIQNMLEVRLLHTQAQNNSHQLAATVREVEAAGEITRRESAELSAQYERAVVEQKLAESLLLNVLPGSAAGRLREHPESVADSHAEVSVLVADITGFTTLACRPEPDQVASILTALFTEFDRIGSVCGLVSMWTVGDPYIAAAGLGAPVDDHANRAAALGLAIVETLTDFARRTGHDLHVRVGISSGPVAAGVAGNRQFVYDLWGDTVQNARRLEADGVTDHVVVSDSTRSLLGPQFAWERRADRTAALPGTRAGSDRAGHLVFRQQLQEQSC